MTSHGKTKYPWGNTPWPGAEKSGTYKFNPDQIDTVVVAALRRHLTTLKGSAGVSAKLDNVAQVGTGDTGKWPAATAMADDISSTGAGLKEFHRSFVESYEAVVNAIAVSVDNLRTTEHVTTKAATSVARPA